MAVPSSVERHDEAGSGRQNPLILRTCRLRPWRLGLPPCGLAGFAPPGGRGSPCRTPTSSPCPCRSSVRCRRRQPLLARGPPGCCGRAERVRSSRGAGASGGPRSSSPLVPVPAEVVGAITADCAMRVSAGDAAAAAPPSRRFLALPSLAAPHARDDGALVDLRERSHDAPGRQMQHRRGRRVWLVVAIVRAGGAMGDLFPERFGLSTGRPRAGGPVSGTGGRRRRLPPDGLAADAPPPLVLRLDRPAVAPTAARSAGERRGRAQPSVGTGFFAAIVAVAAAGLMARAEPATSTWRLPAGRGR